MNIGHWSKLEDWGRTTSGLLKKKLDVITGAIGHLKLKNKNTGKMVDAYLGDDKKFIVPAIHFKLYINPANNASVAFFTSNNNQMEAAEVTNFKKMCDSKCDEIKFKFSKDEVLSGVTVCCTYQDFIKNVDFVDRKVSNAKLLVMP